MGRHRRKKRTQEEVTLNMAAMLDMAFQLLAYFILTFQPAPVEGQISLRMPDPLPLTGPSGGQPGNDEKIKNPLASLQQLVVSLYANKAGEIDSIAVGTNTVATVGSTDQKLASLRRKLNDILDDPAGSAFDTIVLQAGSGLRYEEVMKAVDICARQKLHNGSPLTKLTFQELRDATTPK